MSNKLRAAAPCPIPSPMLGEGPGIGADYCMFANEC